LPDEVSELTPEHLAEIEANPFAYLEQTTELLNALGNSAFGPDLSRLDALVFSIRVPSTGDILPPPVGDAPEAVTTPRSGAATPPPPPSEAGAGLSRLLGADWKWLETSSPSGTLTVDAPSKYTIRFNNAGGFGVTADCNIGAGNFAVKGDELTIQDLQSTLAFCGQESLDSKFTSQLLTASTFSFEGDNLLIGLAGGSTMKFGK
jgi:heat shock protein HslJ